MNRTIRIVLLAPLALLTASACALRLGGSGPETYSAVAIRAEAGADATAIATQLRDAGADLVLLSAEQDSTWFASVAGAAGLDLSGPGETSGRGLAFMTSLELLGDTSLVLDVAGGGEVHMHDALYKIDDRRNIDLMFVRFDGPDLRAAVRTLLGYIATDVGASAALLLAIDASTPQVADSATVLVRATLGNAAECGDITAAATTSRVRLLYGPSARLTCLSAQALPNGVFARVQVPR